MASTHEEGKDHHEHAHPARQFIRVPELPDDLDLQIALDEMADGSQEALKLLLAKQAGVGPSEVTLVSRPWTAPEEDDGATMSYVGKLDSLAPSNWPSDPLVKTTQHMKYISFTANDDDEPYEYAPLRGRQIRLLRLGRNESRNGEVYNHLKVEIFDLDHAPEYLCLSYVWGVPEPAIPVRCDGRVLFVTQNLYSALDSTFDRFPTQYLWADGICINQTDFEERASQVRLMGEVYSKCQMVVARPGHHRYIRRSKRSKEDDTTVSQIVDGETQVLPPLETLQLTEKPPTEPTETILDARYARPAISLMNLLTRVWSKQNKYHILMDSEWAQHSLPDPSTDEGASIWDSLAHFWQEDWLWRVWVLPECLLPPKVIVFNDRNLTSLDSIVEFWEAAKTHGLPSSLRHGILADLLQHVLHVTPVTSFSALRSQLGSGDSPSLLNLLSLFRTTRATDPRDKVYALLSLASRDGDSLQPDYSPSNPPAKLFHDLARKLLSSGLRPAELLPHAGSHHPISPDLPSWVPDWTHRSRSELRVELYNRHPSPRSSPSASAPPPLSAGAPPPAPAHTPNLTATSPRPSPSPSSIPAVISAPAADPRSAPTLPLLAAKLGTLTLLSPAWKFYDPESFRTSHLSPFYPMQLKDGSTMDFPPFSSEDARCFLLNFAKTFASSRGERAEELYGEAEGGVEEAVARTLCGDVDWKGRRISESEEVRREWRGAWRAFEEFYSRGPDENGEYLREEGVRVHHPEGNRFIWVLGCSEEEGEELMRRLWPFAMALQEMMRGRRFAVLEDGRFAVVPWDAEKGDEVWDVEGGRVPFVFRGREEGDEGHRDGRRRVELVGDCYVHGIMDGEVLEGGEWEEILVV